MVERSNLAIWDRDERVAQDPLFFTKQSVLTPPVFSEGLGGWALQWLERQALPHLILSNALDVLWGNSTARAALDARRDVHISGQIFAAVDHHHQQELHDFLVGSRPSLASWSMPCADGDGRLIFRAQRLDEAPFSPIGLTFYTSGSEFRAPYAELDRVFKLTKAQHGVLTDLLAGHDVDAIAQLRKISVETVRTHVRLIYSKVGVNSREALFHILQPFRL